MFTTFLPNRKTQPCALQPIVGFIKHETAVLDQTEQQQVTVRLHTLYMHILSKCSLCENSLHRLLLASSSSSSSVLESLVSDLSNWQVFHQFLMAETAIADVFSAWVEKCKPSVLYHNYSVRSVLAWPMYLPTLTQDNTKMYHHELIWLLEDNSIV